VDKLEEKAIYLCNLSVVVLGAAGNSGERARSLETPRNDIKTGLLCSNGIRRWDDGLVVRSGGQEVAEWRGQDLDSLCGEVFQAQGGVGKSLGGVTILNQVSSLLTESWELLDPLENICRQETLGPDSLCGDSALDESVDHVTSVLLLRVAIEGHWNISRRGLELRGEVSVAWKLINQGDVRFESHDSAAAAVEVGSPGWSSVLERLWSSSGGIETVLLSAQAGELLLGDVRGAARGSGWGSSIRWSERNGALCSQLGSQENVGRGVEITLGVSADESKILGESDITLEDTGAHSCTSHGALDGLFWELKSSTTSVANREATNLELVILTRLELGLEGTLGHVVDQVEWTRIKRDLVWSCMTNIDDGSWCSCRQCHEGESEEGRSHLEGF
jgi:hypothetical protein